MKSKLAIVLAALSSSSFAALVSVESLQTFDGAGDTGFVVGGVPVQPTQGLARVGIFTSLTDVQITALADARDYDALVTGMSILASDDFTGIAAAYGAIPGFVSMSVNNYSPTGTFSLYTLVNSGSAWAFFKHAETLVPDPAPPALPNTYGLSLSNGNLLVGTATTYTTNLSAIGGPASVTTNGIQLIPEPSAALLGALGALGLLRRRRN